MTYREALKARIAECHGTLRLSANQTVDVACDLQLLLAQLERAEAALVSFRSQLTERIKLCPPHSHVVYEFKAYLKQTNEALAPLRAVLDSN